MTEPPLDPGMPDLEALGVADPGRVRVGAGWRGLPAKPVPAVLAETADRRTVRIGADWRLAAR